jgi:hypothetical protein
MIDDEQMMRRCAGLNSGIDQVTENGRERAGDNDELVRVGWISFGDSMASFHGGP